MPSAVRIDLGTVVGTVTVLFDDAALAARVAWAFGARVCEDAPTRLGGFAHHVRGSAKQGYVLDDGTAVSSEAELVGLLDYALDEHIRSCATSSLCTVHACGVVLDGRAVAILGTSGAGKTTLGLACSLAGMPHLGDEFGFLDLVGGQYSQAHYPLCVRAGTWDALDASPPHAALPLVTPWGGTALMCPTAFVDGAAAGEQVALPLGAIVVPQRSAVAAPQLKPLSVAEWPDALMPSLDAPLPRDLLFRSLVRLCAAKGVGVYRATYSTPADGVALIREVKTAC